MRQSVRRWLVGAGSVTAVGAAVLSQAGIASGATAATAAVTGRAAPVHAAVAPAYVSPKKIILYGAHGKVVRQLQERLRVLHYYPGTVDGKFGQDTLEAVWAFKEVQGIGTRSHPNDVTVAMESKLVHPRLPKVLVPHGGSKKRVEVNQNIQVLVLYNHNKVELISHVSTGGGYTYPCPPPGSGTCGPAITPDGNYRAHWFAPGWLKVPLGAMYNPTFFIGGSYAIHGDIPVPLQPVSHGCVRIPMHFATFFHKLITISEKKGVGTPIYIRGHAPGA
jgi:peptidoglycan hydrolase-like protein with peptidoglycan-binding domain